MSGPFPATEIRHRSHGMESPTSAACVLSVSGASSRCSLWIQNRSRFHTGSWIGAVCDASERRTVAKDKATLRSQSGLISYCFAPKAVLEVGITRHLLCDSDILSHIYAGESHLLVDATSVLRSSGHPCQRPLHRCRRSPDAQFACDNVDGFSSHAHLRNERLQNSEGGVR